MHDPLFERLYEIEWSRRNELQGAVSLPLGVLALLGSALVVLFKDYKQGGGVLDSVFWGSFVSSCTGFVIAAYMIVRSFYGYVYQHIPFPSELKTYRESLEAHHRALGDPLRARQEFEAFLEERYIEATDRNVAHNTNRGEYLHKANQATIVTLLALGVCAVPFSIRARAEPPETHRVEITNLRSMVMSQTKPDAPARPAAPVVPPKPVPPSNFDVRTGIRPPPPRPARP